MTDVKPRRRYDSQRRREQAAQTRRDIEAAAGKLFRERGYAATPISLIAAEAGLAVETIYRAFGSKAGLFRAVVEAAIAGGAARAEIPPDERPAIVAIREERDPGRQLELYAATQPGIHRRAGALRRALASAAETDAELRALHEELESYRLNGMGRFMGLLAERGALRPGMSVEQARDIIWTLCSAQVHDMLVIERGWTDDEYRDWLADVLKRELLGDGQ